MSKVTEVTASDINLQRAIALVDEAIEKVAQRASSQQRQTNPTTKAFIPFVADTSASMGR